MPIGLCHVEAGWIDVEEGWSVLRTDGGGRWRLDGPGSLRRLCGERVLVEGVRDGFDLLAVNAFTVDGGRRREVFDSASALGWCVMGIMLAVIALGAVS